MRRTLLVLLLIAGLTVVARGGLSCDVLEAQPACYVAFLPGPTRDTLTSVEVDGAPTYTSSGRLLLTTILLDTDLDLGSWVQGALSTRVAQVPRRAVYPEGTDDTRLGEVNTALMIDSQLDATIAALRALGFEFDEEFDGAEVREVTEDSAVEDDELVAGDVIVGVDGTLIRSAPALVDVIDTRAPGDRVTLDVRRGVETRTVELVLGSAPDDPDDPSIGIIVSSYLELPVDVAIDAGAIGGPSAGLMFALAIIDALGPDDLTGGRVIAGTGEIDRTGTVGAIGGIRQKIIGAAEGDDDTPPASVFLVPADNAEEARGAPVDHEILVVPVANLDHALAALADLEAGREPPGAFALGG